MPVLLNDKSRKTFGKVKWLLSSYVGKEASPCIDNLPWSTVVVGISEATFVMILK